MEYEGGVLTAFRLRVARAAVWAGWSLALVSLKLLVRREHPTRVYLEGAKHTHLVIQLDGLRTATGPRMCRASRWKLTAFAVGGTAIAIPGETAFMVSLLTYFI